MTTRVYKYPLYPSREQQTLFWMHSNYVSRLYNLMLDRAFSILETTGKCPSQYTLNYELRDVKELYPELREIHSQVLQQVMFRIATSMRNWLRGHVRRPRYNSAEHFFTLCYPQNGYSIQQKKFHTKIYGDMTLHTYRPIEGKVQQVSIVHDDVYNRWYLCVSVRCSKILNLTSQSDVGIDVGTKTLVATSDGELIKTPLFVKQYDRHIDRIRTKRNETYKEGSRNHKHLTKVIRRLYGAKGRKLNNFLHETSHRLSNTYDTIYYEDLRIKQMGESPIHGRNRDLRNASIGRLLGMVDYKANHAKAMNPMYTSSTCSQCGTDLGSTYKSGKVPLSVRTITCPCCGLKLDRDVNAARNVLTLGRAWSCGFIDSGTIDRQNSIRGLIAVINSATTSLTARIEPATNIAA